jgi:hypothetical protein
MVVDLCALEELEPVNPTGDPADSHGFVPPGLASVGCRPRAKPEDACRSLHAVGGDTTPGRRLFPCTLATFSMLGAVVIHGWRCHGELCGHGPPAPHQLTGDGDVSRATGIEVHDVRVMISRDVGDRNRFLMDIHSDVKQGKLWQG